jgi:hypothetical protein
LVFARDALSRAMTPRDSAMSFSDSARRHDVRRSTPPAAYVAIAEPSLVATDDLRAAFDWIATSSCSISRVARRRHVLGLLDR